MDGRAMTYSGKKGHTMNITVYLGASGERIPVMKLTPRSWCWIADHGHTLIYGGSGRLMGPCLREPPKGRLRPSA